MIIHMNGKGGVGKLTVAKILVEKLGARYIDNHSVIDLTTKLHAWRSDGYFSMMKKIMRVVLEELAEKPKQDITIFTNWLSSVRFEDRERLDSIARFSKEKEIPFIQILLECDFEENSQRLINEDRKSKGKLMDKEIFAGLYHTSDIYHPPADYALIIDTTGKTAEETSQKIIDYIEEIQTQKSV